jgi:tRNA (guanine37-N1)-methyltransferase
LFDQNLALDYSTKDRVVLICGRYEGVDQRVADHLITDEVSIGDFVLSGGEIPAMLIVDAVTRLIPGVLGCEQSAERESFVAGLLDYPHYTRPAEYRGLKVPDVLLSGNHAEIERWRWRKSVEQTLRRRPDLIKADAFSLDERQEMNAILNDIDETKAE